MAGQMVVEWEPMVIGRDYFTRQATILLKFAKATKDQKVAASLIEKDADLNLQVDSPMPNRPMTATTKLTPFTSSSIPMVSRTLPETVSIPTAASAKPIASETRVLIGG